MLINYLFLTISFTCFAIGNKANEGQSNTLRVANKDESVNNSNQDEPIAPPNPLNDPVADDECNSRYFQFLVDSKYIKGDNRFVKGANNTIFVNSILPENSILIGTETVVSAVYLPDRLRINYNDEKENIVTQVACG